MRSKFCEKQINRLKNNVDIIFQLQGMFMPAVDPDSLSIPYVIFTDYTMKLAEKYPLWMPFKSQVQSWYKLEISLYRHAALNFTTTENAKRSMIKDYGVNEDKVVVAGSGTNFDEIPAEPRDYDGKTILFVGKDFSRKGGYFLLEAFRKVKKVIPDARLIIAGPRKSTLCIKEPGVDFLGLVEDRERIKSLYRQASIFVLPSLCEPFALVFMEAMAYGLPCIGTTIDAMSEIIEDGRNGLLVAPGDAQGLSEKIILLLKNEPLMRQMGQAGFLRIQERFTWDKVAEKIGYHLDNILKSRNKNQ